MRLLQEKPHVGIVFRLLVLLGPYADQASLVELLCVRLLQEKLHAGNRLIELFGPYAGQDPLVELLLIRLPLREALLSIGCLGCLVWPLSMLIWPL